MANRHIPTSLRLMPRAFIWVDPVKTCTEVFSNWRCRRRLSCLELGLRIIRYAVRTKLAQRSARAKVTEVQWLRIWLGALVNRVVTQNTVVSAIAIFQQST